MKPIELLPIKPPSEFDPSIDQPDFFYQNVVKPLIPDTLRIMQNGIHIDQDAVDELRVVIDKVLKTVRDSLDTNQVIKDYQAYEYPKKFAEYQAEVEASMRDINFYLKPYNPANMVHRTYVVNEYLVSGICKPDLCRPQWSVKDVKTLMTYTGTGFLSYVLDKSLDDSNITVSRAMETLAQDKLDIWNKPRQGKIDNATMATLLPPFNSGSTTQLRKLFTFLHVEPIAFSKETGEPSWNRDALEELLRTAEDGNYKDMLQAFIDYSSSNIIKTNFLEAFDKFTINGVLHGNLKLFGAKTFRYTSNSPNLLNMPSTGSIYAKPLKKCFVAPEGYLVATIDYSALEDRVIANLSGDENKLALFLQGLDGHSLGATYYFPDRVKELVGEYTDHKEASKLLKALVDKRDKAAKSVRQDGKPVTFGISYGAFPPKISATIKCPLPVAEAIFDAYHNEMYPGITKFREDVILKAAKKDGYVHLGLGCTIKSDDVRKDSRTLFNAVSQFWSILTLLTINALHYEIDEASMGDDVKVTSTIYDSIYFIVKEDATVIKWLNDTIVPIMETDFLEDQIVPNSANLEIGENWSDMIELAHNISEERILEHIADVKGELPEIPF